MHAPAAAVLLMSGVGLAQDSQPAAALLPITTETTWVYQTPALRGPTFVDCVGPAAQPPFGAGWFELAHSGTVRATREWWRITSTEIAWLRDEDLEFVADPQQTPPPRRLAQLPLVAGAKWSHSELAIWPATAGSTRQRVEYAGEVLALAEAVVVPAGRFLATKVRLVRRTQGFVDREILTWIAPGVGIVRQTDSADPQESPWTRDLVRHMVSRHAPDDELRARVTQHLGTAPSSLDRLGDPAWRALRHTQLCVAMVAPEATRQLLAVRADRVAILDPRNPRSWQDLAASEHSPYAVTPEMIALAIGWTHARAPQITSQRGGRYPPREGDAGTSDLQVTAGGWRATVTLRFPKGVYEQIEVR